MNCEHCGGHHYATEKGMAEQLDQIQEHPVWSGNLISKPDKDALVCRGLVEWSEDAQDPTEKSPGAYAAAMVN